MLLATSIFWQKKAPTMYEQYAVQAGKEIPGPGFISRDMAFLRSLTGFIIIFYTCLWTVKLSFLFFFRRLGSKVRGHKNWWRCVLVITILTWLACIGDIPYKCLFSSFEFITGEFYIITDASG